MTQIDIVQIFSSLNGNGFVGVDSETIPALKGGKKNPMLGNVKKVVTGSNAQMFQNKFLNGYEQMVRRRLEAEGKNGQSFQLSARTWGIRIAGMPLIEHKGKYYLELIYQSAGKVEYFYDGKQIDKADVIGLDDSSEAEQGGIANKVIIRTIALENVKALRYGGQEYRGEFVVGEVN